MLTGSEVNCGTLNSLGNLMNDFLASTANHDTNQTDITQSNNTEKFDAPPTDTIPLLPGEVPPELVVSGTPRNAFTSSLDLPSYIKSHQTSFSSVVIVVANNAHRDFVLNWVVAMRRNIHNQDGFIIVCVDKKLFEFLQQPDVDIPSIPISSLIQRQEIMNLYSSNDGGDEALWMQANYNLITNLKIEVVYLLMKNYNQRVIFNDVDLVWLNDKIVDYIDHVLNVPGVEVALAADGWNYDYSWMCTGFYAVEPSEFALNFIQQVNDSELKHSADDQAIMGHFFLKLSGDDKQKIKFLPMLWFQNGWISDRDLPEFYHVKPWIVHANYRIGARDKRKLLKRENAWYLFYNETDEIVQNTNSEHSMLPYT